MGAGAIVLSGGTSLLSRCRNVGRSAIIFAIVLGAWLVFSSAPASAEVRHSLEGTFTGSDAPEGPFVAAHADAVDTSGGASNGDVYVGELGAIDKFNASGVYAGVRITGAETPQGSFSLVSFTTFVASQITVDGSSSPNKGDLYVADIEHGVVDKFNESGHYLCQITGATTHSISECDTVNGSETPNGSIEPTGLTVDKATGDLYVADAAHDAIDEFGPSGDYIGQITDSHITSPGPIAIDSLGDIYVTNGNVLAIFASSLASNNIVKFHNGSFEKVLDENEPLAVAVDPTTNHVYAYDFRHEQLTEYGASGGLLDHFAAKIGVATGFGTGPWESLAVASTGEVYGAQLIDGSNSGVVFIFGPDVVFPTVTTDPATNVQQSSVTLNGHVDPDAADGGGEVTGCEFEYVTDKQFQQHSANHYEGASTAPCSPSTQYSSAAAVSANVTVAPSTLYHFRLKASNANGANEGAEETFSTFGPPVVDSESSLNVGTTSATVRAQIDPFGFDTTCQAVQYVNDADFKSSGYGNAKTSPCAPAGLGSGFADQGVSTVLSELQVNTTYHFRFVAVNQTGTTVGADTTFATFGISSFKVEVLDKEGQPYTQAGGHPYEWITSFALNETTLNSGAVGTEANLKDIQAEYPAGLTGNPTATPKCAHIDFTGARCAPTTQVGVLHVDTGIAGDFEEGVFNLAPPPGVPAEFGALISNFVQVYIIANVRSGGDYGITGTSPNTTMLESVRAVKFTLWGNPSDPGHDGQRFCPEPTGGYEIGDCPIGAEAVPFLTNPTSCSSSQVSTLTTNSWQELDGFATATSLMPAITGCNRLNFAPSVSILPDTSAADSPSGVSVDLHVPQSEVSTGLATPALRDVTVGLPAGVTLNPAAANGLQACSLAQIGLGSPSEPTCPDSSKVGSVEVETPLLADKLKGSVYLAEQNNNPFGSMLALYVTAEVDGALIKVAGKVEADPVTGQLTSTFDNNPQLPFSDFRLHFFGGPRAPLATPKLCGTYTTTTLFTPWSAPESGPSASPSSSFQILSGAGGAPCGSPGFAPGFTAGTTSNQAGGFSPFTFTMSRNDGEQNLGTVSTVLPPGLVGMLSKVPLCAETQANEGTCPAASLIGHVTTGVGAGPDPLFVPEAGKPANPVFLTGPYKGAPFGLSVVVPPEAGPFNLGENGKPVVVRATVNVDPLTAQVTVTSDPLPQILKGIPLDIRSVNVTIDRPEFIVNPSSCEKMRIAGNITSAPGVTGHLTVPFQVTNCAALAFKPQFKVSTAGKTSRANGASLDVKLAYPKAPSGSQANIKSVKVDLPKQLPSRLTTLQKACPDNVFNQNPAACPAASRIGSATATTPIIPVGLSGPAYFVSHGGAKFPELVIVLSGYGVTVQLHGETFISAAGITSSTFRTIPDVSIGTFELRLPQGKFSALAANGNLCAASLKMPTTFTAQNGLIIHQSTSITATGCAKHKKTTKRTRKPGRGGGKVKKRN